MLSLTVTEGLGDMDFADFRPAFKVSQRSGHAQDTVITARGQVHHFDRYAAYFPFFPITR